MTPSDWERLKQLYYEALNLPPEERAAYVEKVRQKDEELGRHLADLLTKPDSDILDCPFFDFHDDTATSRDETATMTAVRGPLILAGRFRVLRHVGKGGMGEVFGGRGSETQRARRLEDGSSRNRIQSSDCREIHQPPTTNQLQ